MKLGIALTAIILALTINTAEAKHGHHHGHHHRPFHGARSHGAIRGARARVRHASHDRSDNLMTGFLDIAGNLFHFVSGGHGWPIPIGDWEITPHDVGPWGARNGALGINHDDPIPDPRLHRNREGIEIHAANRYGTAGCIGILERFDRLKRLVFQMIDQYGTAWLHVIPGEIVITPTPRFALDEE